MTGFLNDPDSTATKVFLQWKGTDACFDFYCDCGVQTHFDGYFAYWVRCPACRQEWEMPHHLYPRKGERHRDDCVVEPVLDDPPYYWKDEEVGE